MLAEGLGQGLQDPARGGMMQKLLLWPGREPGIGSFWG